jgi:DNA mismatch repair protein MutS2
MHIYLEDCISRFEFDRICSVLEKHCRSSSSKMRARELLPISELPEILIQLNRTREFRDILKVSGYFPNTLFPDISKEIGLLAIQHSSLSENQFVSIREISEIVNALLNYFDEKQSIFPALNSIFLPVYPTDAIIDAINKVIDNVAIVKSSASKELGQIRKQLADARRELDKEFRSQLNRLRKLGWLADTEETVYNGRRVLSVLAEQKRTVKGLVYGSSETGKTTFVEPIETVELNNEVFELIQQEKQEIKRILRQLTHEIRHYLPLIQNYQLVLSELDFCRAKALLAIDLDGNLPVVTKYAQVKLIHAKHPILLLQHKSSGKKVVSMSCKLDQDDRLLIISGPNAGGKSIALKTVGLIQLMVQSGLLVPVDEQSELGVFHQFFADIGDSQSIEYELSTYSSRLKKMKHILEFATKRSLVLIDEFGTGTDPELGGAIAEAMLEELVKLKSIGVITTHYTNIKLAADRLEAVKNACMQFDEESLKPLYKLLVGQPGSSYTFVIAEKTGFSAALIDRARSKISGDKIALDLMLQQLNVQQQAVKSLSESLEEREKQAKESRIRYDSMIEIWKQKLERKKVSKDEDQKFISLGKKFELFTKEWDSAKDKKPVMQKIVRALSAERLKKLDKKQQEKKEKLKAKLLEARKSEITVGCKVKLLNGKQTGIVEEIMQNRARVIFGNLKTIASLENLIAVI